MHDYEENSWINIGSSEEISIHDLAYLIKKVVNFDGDIIFDTSQPDGTPRKFLDSSRMRALGWKPLVALYEGLSETYTWFLKNKVNNSKYYEFTNTL
jgi:nucleoside-diphosphate-sugar epimerase